MCIAKETPESSFDLVDCNLSEVPPGVFSMCRVFLKESLLLGDNKLISIRNGGSLKDLSGLLVLHLQNNRLSSLPDDIYYLSNLQELNLENNHLKKLPSTFENLINLKKLNLKGNRLICFPSPVSSLYNLEFLNICYNSKIKTLPRDLCNLVLLRCLELDAESMTYPTSDICSGGTESIMKFLCSESSKEYVPPEDSNVSQHVAKSSGPSDDSPDLSASYMQYQKAKMQKQQDLLLMEEALKQNFELQSYAVDDANQRRQKLLEDITLEQERMENEIVLLQNRKDKEKQTLLEILSKVEDHSAKLIDHLMALNDRTKDLNKMLAVLEQDRLENEEIFTIKHEELENLRKKEIIEAMTQQLQSEEKHRDYEKEKDSIHTQLQNEENESNLKLLSMFHNREIDQQILINTLLEEEQFQKQAFEALQLQKDMQHNEIAQQILLIEKELAKLTAAEIKKKDLKIDTEVNILAEHRTALAYLLTDLLSAQDQRKKDLKERLNQMEQQRVNEMEDFWLIQYQKLMDRKPMSVMNLEAEIDPAVRCVLEDAKALDFLPMFAVKHVTLRDLIGFSISDLKTIGVLDENICQNILDIAWEHFRSEPTEKDEYSRLSEFEEPSPSAPPNEDDQHSPVELQNPTAPLLSPDSETKLWCQSECVICLDKQSSSVFLPCGHVCCCQSCSTSVELCPMCRSAINSKFTLTIS